MPPITSGLRLTIALDIGNNYALAAALATQVHRDHADRDPVMTFCVYILTNKPYGTLYVGMTSDLLKRVWEHKNKVVPGFTRRYGLDRLVWFETCDQRETALRREKQIKEWRRDWKINLIERNNPHWIDLSSTLTL